MITWLCILAGAGVLVYLQYSWIIQASAADRERQETVVYREGLRAVDAAFNEVRVLLPAVRSFLGGRTDSAEMNSFTENLEILIQHAEYPDFFSGAWICMPDESPVLLYPSSNGETLTLPPQVMEVVRNVYDRDFSTYRESMQRLGLEGFILIEVPPRTGQTVLGILKFDIHMFYDEIIPRYLRQELPGYDFSISRVSGDHDIEHQLFRTGNSPGKIFIPVPGFYYTGAGQQRDGIFASLQAESYSDRRQTSISESWDQSRPLRPLYSGILEISLPHGILEAQERNRIISNLAVSIGILFLLLLSIAAVFMLYRRSRELRRMEQEFVASMSHELRLPLTVIKAISDNMASGIIRDTKRIRTYGEELTREADRLVSMVESILTYAGLQNEGRTTEMAVIDVPGMVKDIFSELSLLESWDSRNISSTVQVGNVPFKADVKGIRMAVRNLLLNSLYHAKPEGKGETAEIHLHIYRKPVNILSITVEDNGPGIPKKLQKKVFDPFYRLDHSIDRQIPGSGLGLHIVKRTIEVNKGGIFLESPYSDTVGTYHSGCRITLELPIREVES